MNKKHISELNIDGLCNALKLPPPPPNYDEKENMKMNILEVTDGDISCAKALYNWIINEGKENIDIRFKIVKNNFNYQKDILSLSRMDIPYMTRIDEIYQWIKI
jgi:hypothetical protein